MLGCEDFVDDMFDNFVYLIDMVGYILNGNCMYYVSCL